jgi:hypothetical protein
VDAIGIHHRQCHRIGHKIGQRRLIVIHRISRPGTGSILVLPPILSAQLSGDERKRPAGWPAASVFWQNMPTAIELKARLPVRGSSLFLPRLCRSSGAERLHPP